MAQLAGYARMLAKHRVMEQQNRRIFGAPYLKYGQCYATSGYFLQLGGILTCRHRHNLDAFGTAFLGLQGESGAMARFCESAAKRMANFITEPMSFADYVEV